MEAKNAKEYNDRCGSETDRLSLREEIKQKYNKIIADKDNKIQNNITKPGAAGCTDV